MFDLPKFASKYFDVYLVGFNVSGALNDYAIVRFTGPLFRSRTTALDLFSSQKSYPRNTVCFP